MLCLYAGTWVVILCKRVTNQFKNLLTEFLKIMKLHLVSQVKFFNLGYSVINHTAYKLKYSEFNFSVQMVWNIESFNLVHDHWK